MKTHLHDSECNFSLGGTCPWLERSLQTMIITFVFNLHIKLIVISTESLLRGKNAVFPQTVASLFLLSVGHILLEKREGTTWGSHSVLLPISALSCCLSKWPFASWFSWMEPEIPPVWNRKGLVFLHSLHQCLLDQCKLTVEERLLAGRGHSHSEVSGNHTECYSIPSIPQTCNHYFKGKYHLLWCLSGI